MGKILRTNAGKTVIWIIGNALFGLAPYLFMKLINFIAVNPNSTHDIQHFINDGSVLFVCSALMGSVVIDTLIDKHQYDNLVTFALIMSPFAVLFLLLTVYLLVVFKAVNDHYFSSNSWLYYFTIGFSIVYCTLAKYNLFKREVKNE